MGFYTITALIQLASRVDFCHGELRFLHQWVSATSALRSFGRLHSPREYIVRHVELWSFALWNFSPWARLSFAIARFLAFHSPWRVVSGTLWLYLPWARYGEFINRNLASVPKPIEVVKY